MLCHWGDAEISASEVRREAYVTTALMMCFYFTFFFLLFPSFPSLDAGWLRSFGPCNSATVSINLSLDLGLSVRSDSGSSPLDPTSLTEGRYSATSQEPRKKASPLFNRLCYEVMLLWADIIF